jgi:hypothetical protein
VDHLAVGQGAIDERVAERTPDSGSQRPVVIDSWSACFGTRMTSPNHQQNNDEWLCPTDHADSDG